MSKEQVEGAAGAARSCEVCEGPIGTREDSAPDTPVEFRDSAFCWAHKRGAHVAVSMTPPAYRTALRAAEARRDALWREALRDSCRSCLDAAAGDGEWSECTSGDCPLRTLLGAAEPKAPPDPFLREADRLLTELDPSYPAAALVEQQEGQQGAADGELDAEMANLLNAFAGDTVDAPLFRALREHRTTPGPEFDVALGQLERVLSRTREELHAALRALSGEPPARPPAPAAAALATSREGLRIQELEGLLREAVVGLDGAWTSNSIIHEWRDRVRAALASLDRAAQEQ